MKQKKMIQFSTLSILGLFISISAFPQHPGLADHPDGCTVVSVGNKASFDGSVMTSHTDDSHRSRTNMGIRPAADHPEGSMRKVYTREKCDTVAMPAYMFVERGEIPQIEHTYQYINTEYPAMNEHQLGMGESTFGGRKELKSEEGLLDIIMLSQICMERCTTAREAIMLIGKLTKEYGYNDIGECLHIADKDELWHFEIVGPGKGKVGAIWAAVRIPDGHVGVSANASRIRTLDLDDEDNYLASDNLTELAEEMGWWKPADGPFEFCYAYAPHGRYNYMCSRREWRVLDLVAPSLGLDARANDFPLSVKPDTLVSLEKMFEIFRDTYEGTPYDFVKNITQADKDGKQIKSPFANPFMPYDMYKVFDISETGGWFGERTIARWYTIYATIIQCRADMPDEVGGVVWLAWDNVATSVYVPIYCQNTDLPASYKVEGRRTGYTRESAWWGFNRMSTLAGQRWGDMRWDVDSIFVPMQQELFNAQAEVERKALDISDKQKRIDYLTRYSIEKGEKAVDAAWKLGDFLWTKWEEKF
jgi:dipeptidase